MSNIKFVWTNGIINPASSKHRLLVDLCDGSLFGAAVAPRGGKGGKDVSCECAAGDWTIPTGFETISIERLSCRDDRSQGVRIMREAEILELATMQAQYNFYCTRQDRLGCTFIIIGLEM